MKIVERNTELVLQGARFSIVGVLNVAVSFIVFHLCYVRWQVGQILLNQTGIFGDNLHSALSQLGIASVDAAIATGLGYLAGILNSYVLNSIWTFRVVRHSRIQFLRFLALNVVGLGVTSSLMFYFVDLKQNPYLATWILVTGVVMILNYLGSKYWVFKFAH